MSLNLLIDRIHTDTEREAKAIREQAEREAQAMEAENLRREEALLKRELAGLRSQLEFEARKERSARELECKRSFLEEREVHLSAIRRRLEEKLLALPAGEERALLAGFLTRGRKILSAGRVELSARAAEMLAKDLNGFEPQADESGSGGLRLVAGDERVAVDLTYASVVEEFWTRRRAEIAVALFGTGKGGAEPA